MSKAFAKSILLILFSLLWVPTAYSQDTSLAFFKNVSQLCGKTFEGKSVYPADKDDSFFGKKLVMQVKSCSEREIRIPFSVGEDHSRTWVLSLTDKGLLLKHDHRHEDGSPHELTMYGGYASQSGTAHSQSFPADEQTKILVPKGTTNVWHLTIDKTNQQFVYYLERHNKPRFKAVLSLL